MKIAIVLNTSWNVFNFRMGLLKALMKEGNEVHVMAPWDNYSDKLIEAGCGFTDIRMDSRGANPVKDLGLIMELYVKYKQVAPDVILHYTIKPNIYGSIAASFCNIPVINNVSGLGTVFLKKSPITNIAKLLYKYSFRHPEVVFFQNADDRDLFLTAGLVNKSQTRLLPGSGIDTSHFTPQIKPKGNPFTFLVISRLIYDKGIQEYADAINILRAKNIEAKFQLLGAKDPEHKRGIPLEKIDSWVNSETMEYLGTTDDVRKYIADADCIVLPSYREGTPRTLLEAACLGKPIVTTDVPGCRNVVENGKNGLLCEPRSATDLADKMNTMLSMQNEDLMEMGRFGRAKMEQEFDEALVIDQYLHSINQLRKPQEREDGN